MASSVNYGTQQYFGFDPRTLPGCQLWLDAADSNVFSFSSGSNVSQWRDKSGNANHLSVINTTSPTVTIDTGRPVVAFATGNVLRTANPISYAAQTTTVFIVAKNTNFGDISMVFAFADDNSSGNTGDYSIRYGGGVLGSGDSNDIGFNGNYFVNGVQSVPSTASTYSAYHLIASPISKTGIGSSRISISSTFLGRFFSGFVGEVIVFTNNQFTTAQRQQVEGYLAWKWSLTTSAGIVSPSTIPGLSLWLDAADASTLSFSSGSNVSQWRDKSGNVNHANAVSGTITLANGNVNLQNAYMSFVNSSLFAGFPGMSVFIVVNITANIQNGHPLVSVLGGAYSHLQWVDNNIYENIGVSSRWNAPASLATSTVLIYELIGDGSITALYSSGLFRNQTTYGNGYTNITYSIGNVGTGINYTGSLYEILVYNTGLATTQRQQVEGYLAWKWGLQAALPSTHPYDAQFALPGSHPYTSIRPTMRVFQPSDVDGLQLWLDSADNATISPANITSGTTITSWLDKSSNGMSVTPLQGVSANPITYRTTTGVPSIFINNGRVVNFNANTRSELSVPLNIQNGFSNFTCIAVVNMQQSFVNLGTSGLMSIYSNPRIATNAGRLQIGVGGTFEANTVNGLLYDLTALRSDMFDQRIILTTISDTTNARQYINGVLTVGRTTLTGTKITTDAEAGPVIGGSRGVDNRYATGDFSEVICYTNALSDTDRNLVESYLATKWNIRGPYAVVSQNILLPNDSSIVGNLQVWNSADSYTTNNQVLTTWVNRTGGTASSCTGTVLTNQLNGQPIVRFSTAATWTSPSINFASHTIFFVGRYNGIGNTGRILQGPSGTNRLYGYWNSNKNVLFIDGNPNLLDANGRAGPANTFYDIMSHKRVNGGAFNFRMNQYTLYTGTTSIANNLTGLSINTGGQPGEASGCDVAEIIIYNSVLTDSQVEQIENYLNAKWNVYLTNFFMNIYSPPAIPLFVPSQLSGLQLWLDAADISTISTSGTNVTQWRDKSGNNRHGNTGVSPSYSGDGILFSGGQSLLVANASGLFTNTSFNIFIVEKVNSGASGFLLGDTVVNGGAATNASLHIGYRTNANLTFAFYNNDLEITGLSGNPTRVWSFNMPASANRNTFLYGSLVATLGNSSKLTTMTTLTLGSIFGGGFYNGRIYEVIGYVGEITASQRQQVEGYLAWKWGLQNSIPTTHPYRRFRA